MYKRIENLYKNENPYNKIKKNITIKYIVTVMLLLICNLSKSYLMMLFVTIGSIIVTKKMLEKELDTKLYLIGMKKTGKTLPLEKIINLKEFEFFYKDLKDNNEYDEKIIMCIIEHYRNLVKPNIVNDNFWSITAIIVSIISMFIDKDGFNTQGFIILLPYLITCAVIVFFINAFIKQVGELKVFFKREDGMYERLENIFTNLYVNCIKEEKIKKKNVNKTKSKKSKEKIKKKKKKKNI